MTDHPLVARLRPEIETGLGDYLDRALDRVANLHPALAVPADELRSYLGGGKRLRPLFALLGFKAGGGVRTDHVLGAALSLELVHTCALLHDDVIDGADTRRGRPTVHVTFARKHAAGHLAGSDVEYGRAVAILLGDLAFTQADELWLDCDVKPERLLDAFRVFTTLREEVMAGQFLDVEAGARRSRSRDTALAVATYKTARYSITRPLEMGATLAGTDQELIDGLRAFGDPLGRAFQVRDDILGVFGSEGQTGKSVSSDLIEGKRTLLVAEALERLDAPGAIELEGLLGKADLDEQGADRARALLRSSGGLGAAEAYVNDATREALQALDELSISAEVSGALRSLAEGLAARTS